MTAVPLPERHRGVGVSSRVSRQGADLCVAMLRSAMVCSHVALLVVMLAGVVAAGVGGGANAVIGGALVMVFLATGQAVQLVAVQWANGAGMVLLLSGFLVRVTAMGLLLVEAMHHQARLSGVFHPGLFFAGAVAALVGWIAGLVGAHRRRHVFAYDHDYDDWMARGRGQVGGV